jgi:hypothetical protein
MSDNSLTPPGSISNVEILSTEDISCSQEETHNRLSFCKGCEHFIFDDYTKCELSGCLINLMTTMQFKSCPKGNW